jgi:DNA-binding MurR/RpiR family transcriptional regulator
MEPFDQDLLAVHLKNKMKDEDLTIRAAAEQVGCSPATLARMLQGSQSDNFPQGKNLLRAVSWVGKSMADFRQGPEQQPSSYAEVETHLRALPNLPPETIEGIMNMVRALSDAKRQR